MAMLELYLIRHGVAAERGDDYPDDSKRPLTSAGHRAAAQGSQGARRARRHLRSHHRQPAGAHEADGGCLCRDAQVQAAVSTERRARAGGHAGGRHAGDRASTCARARIALVGHEPNIGELAAQLIGARTPLEFKKGGICRIDFDVLPPKGAGQLRWFVTPRMLRDLVR